MELRILHLSDDRLPDWRIEKSAISASNLGYEVIFAGRNSEPYHTNTFSRKYELNWTERSRRGIPFYWHSVKKQVERMIKEVRPDIVHAHNIFSAKMISEFHLPFVYDDHEYWSEFSRILAHTNEKAPKHLLGGPPRKALRRLSRNILRRSAIHLWTNWEKEMVSSSPTITVSDKIAQELRVLGNTARVFVVPNFPMQSEVNDFEQPRTHTNLSSVYAGIESMEKQVNRDIDGLNDAFAQRSIGHLTIIGTEGKSMSEKVVYAGLMSRPAMFWEMSKHSIGLLPWKKHWSHTFVSPNKAYEYAHAGLYVVCTSSFETVLQTLKGNCTSFEDYNDLVSQLEYFRENLEELYKKRLKIFGFARNNLTWEKFENNIFRAYQLC
jgi:glycosyltransferase involved in cell wall biosynthesis